MKDALTLAVTGTAFAALVALAALSVLVLAAIPIGLGILAMAFDRATRCLRQACAFVTTSNSKPKQDRTLC